jgi:hypothetical protein
MSDRISELPWEEHTQLGAELYRIRQRIGELSIRLSEIYGEGSRVGALAGKAQKGIDDLRQELDAILFREHAGRSRMELMRVYYGDEDSPSAANRSEPLPFE